MWAVAHRKIRNLSPQKITTCFFGDSTFALWPGLQEAFDRLGISVVNMGFGGATSANMRSVIDPLLQRKADFDVIIVHVGGNDFDIIGHTRDVLTNLLYVKNVAPCKVVFLHVPRKPGYSPKWANLSQIAKTFPDVIDVSWVHELEYHIDGNHATNHSCNQHLAPRIHRFLASVCR
jgi:lysophospholipase L1-like esterase